MAKFSGRSATTARPTRGAGPLATGHVVPTYEGGTGRAVDAKTELFSLLVSSFATEGSFYESADDRLNRLVGLVHQLTAQDPGFVRRLVPWVREVGNMRTGSIVAAAEYAYAGGPEARTVIDLACQRADEPGELLGYCLTMHPGRRYPQAVRKGLADAVCRLYTERSAIKWDGNSKGVRFGDVIELCHPAPKTDAQRALFRHLIDRRHNRAETNLALLPELSACYGLDRLTVDARRAWLGEYGTTGLRDAGWTWERLAGWLPGGMDAQAWETVIPAMGYMALLRNIRNFEAAGVRSTALDSVAARLADPVQVARSRQFPFRFWSAWKASQTMRFGPALEAALDLSCHNIPDLPGRTLVMVDVSGSMAAPVSGRTDVQCADLSALVGAAVAKRCGTRADLVAYATTSARVAHGPSALRTMENVRAQGRHLGGGTNSWPAVHQHYAGHDRVMLFTDMQDHPSPGAAAAGVPTHVPVYVWDLRGYGRANFEAGSGRHLFSGWTDIMFKLIPLLEAGRTVSWDDLFAMVGDEDSGES